MRPPGNSLEAQQHGEVAPAGEGLAEGLIALLARLQEELGYNDAKGDSPYRLGVHDGLRFAEDAVVALLERHGQAAESRPTERDA